MLLFDYAVREPFTPQPLRGIVEATDRADAFNQIVGFYTKELKTSVTELKISLDEVI